jgi:hypothetical protein
MVRPGVPSALALMALLAADMSPARAGEKEEADLCRDDVMRLCMTSVPDRNRIVSCMNAQRESLSPGCRAVLEGASRKARSGRS